MNLKDKNIVLCITGGIAAYKAIYLASLLKKKGANIYPVLTRNALKFVTPLTLKSITEKKVTVKMFDNSDFIPHIGLAELADAVIVAPATANIIAKAATGIADDMVSSLLLSTTAPKIVVPAMNTNMYNNPITQVNIQILKDNGFKVMEPDEGILACGTEGIGRFPETERIYGFLLKQLSDESSVFNNKKIVITLGGTIEDIDPVRYISNRSSGKMGLAFAEEFYLRGGKVTLMCGNVSELHFDKFCKKYSDIEIIKVRSSNDILLKINEIENNFDLLFMSAAVSDYSVKFHDQKIKKSDDEELTLNLIKTKDILKSLKKRNDSLYIGFAAESENLLQNSKNKLIDKNLDFLIANEIAGDKNAIGNDKAEVHLLNKWNDKIDKFNYSSKKEIAASVMNKLEEIIKKNKSSF